MIATPFTREDLCAAAATVEEAMARPDALLWREAMSDERQSLPEKNAWEVTDLPRGQR